MRSVCVDSHNTDVREVVFGSLFDFVVEMGRHLSTKLGGDTTVSSDSSLGPEKGRLFVTQERVVKIVTSSPYLVMFPWDEEGWSHESRL